METDQLFLAADAALRSVVDRIDPDDFDKPVPAGWSQTPDSTIRDILRAHAYDEAWVPSVLAGGSIADGDDLLDRDLLGDDPIAAYGAAQHHPDPPRDGCFVRALDTVECVLVAGGAHADE